MIILTVWTDLASHKKHQNCFWILKKKTKSWKYWKTSRLELYQKKIIIQLSSKTKNNQFYNYNSNARVTIKPALLFLLLFNYVLLSVLSWFGLCLFCMIHWMLHYLLSKFLSWFCWCLFYVFYWMLYHDLDGV